MPTPQQPDVQPVPGADEPTGPVPPENQPGHHPAHEQDKPDLKAFAERLGTVEPSERETPTTEAPSPAGRRRAIISIAAVAALLALIAAVLAGRRRRSR